MTGPVVVVCASCAGLTFTLDACRCVHGGDRFLIDEDQPRDQRPYQDCLLCRGVGTVARPCHDCRQHGTRRAQLVLTVVNSDTGAVASINLVPGGLATRQEPGGRWLVPLTPLVHELAAMAGVHPATCRDLSGCPLIEDSLLLPRDWHPHLIADRRHALDAESLAGQSYQPWRVYLGRGAAPPPPDLNGSLARLCRLADLLRLDLVVEARHRPDGGLAWDIRYEVPGAAVPASPHGYADDLPTAVVTTTVADAMDGLAARSLGAPAHHVRPEPTLHRTETLDFDQLERRVLRDCDARSGAQAIWRNHRWWHTSLRVGGLTETMTELATGQVCRQLTTALLRTWEPPAPAWLGEPIPYTDCPDCDPGSRLRACLCTADDRPADPACTSCDGIGVRPWRLPCFTCGDSRRVYQAAAITVTDLTNRVIHDRWPAQGTTGAQLRAQLRAPLVATQPGGKPVVQLPDRYRLARLAARCGGRPDNLTRLDGGSPVSQDIRDGTITLDRPDSDPLAHQIALVTRGQPAGRLIISTRPPDSPPLTELIRLTLGLCMAITITIEDHRLDADDPLRIHGRRWDIEISSTDLPVALVDHPHQPSLAAAVAHCLSYLENALAATVPTDPRRPIPVPQSSSIELVDDPAALLSRLAHQYAGQPVSVRLDRDGCAIHRHERDGPRLLAAARTLARAETSLGLRPTDRQPD